MNCVSFLFFSSFWRSRPQMPRRSRAAVRGRRLTVVLSEGCARFSAVPDGSSGGDGAPWRYRVARCLATWRRALRLSAAFLSGYDAVVAGDDPALAFNSSIPPRVFFQLPYLDGSPCCSSKIIKTHTHTQGDQQHSDNRLWIYLFAQHAMHRSLRCTEANRRRSRRKKKWFDSKETANDRNHVLA